MTATSTASATATTVPTTVTYDDTDPGISYSPGWIADTLAGDYNGTYHYSGSVGSSAQFTFSGTQITLVFNRAYNRGTLNVAIDGTQVMALSQYMDGVLLQQPWTSGVLAPGAHTLRLTHGGGGEYVDIDAIIVSNP